MLSPLEIMPPPICRLLARKGQGQGTRLLTDTEVAEGSGLNRQHVTHISRLESWDTVAVGHIRQFLHGCRLGRKSQIWHRKQGLKASLESSDPFGVLRQDPTADIIIARIKPEMIQRFLKSHGFGA